MKKCNINTNSRETTAWTTPDGGRVCGKDLSISKLNTDNKEEEKRARRKDHAVAQTNNTGPLFPSNNTCPNCHRVCGSHIGLISDLRTHRPLHSWQSYSIPRDCRWPINQCLKHSLFSVADTKLTLKQEHAYQLKTDKFCSLSHKKFVK